MNNVFAKKRNIGRYILTVIVCIAVGILITLGVSLIFGFRYRVITTDSMAPNMPVGTLVVDKKVNFAEIKVGDVVTYTRTYESNVKVTHRVIEIQDGVLKVKGDNPEHTQVDSVTLDNYVAKVIVSLPQIKIFFDWLYANMFLLLYDAVIILVAYQIIFK